MSVGLPGVPGMLTDSLQGMSVLTMMQQLQQRQQEELMKRSQEAESAASSAQQSYQQAAGEPAPQVGGMEALIPTLLGNVASVIAQDPSYRQRGQETVKQKQSDLLKARGDNLQALRDIYSQKAEAAQRAHNLEDAEKYRGQFEKVSNTMEQIAQRHANAVELENIRQQNRKDLADARGGNEPLEIIEGPDGKPMYVPRSQAAGKKPTTPSGTRGKIPSAAERDALTMDRSMVQQINAAKSRFKPEFTGPGQGTLIGRASQATGFGRRPGEGRFRQSLSGIKNIILKLRSGAAITESEGERLLSELPNVGDPSDTFMDKMNQFEETFRGIAGIRRETLGETGVDISKLSALDDPVEFGAEYVKAAEPETYVRMIRPDGKPRDVPTKLVKDQVAKGWKRAPSGR
jgi:hypothetical protein